MCELSFDVMIVKDYNENKFDYKLMRIDSNFQKLSWLYRL
jgi:hypothetical protein